jgi:mono/diheme cytochrome c family protein
VRASSRRAATSLLFALALGALGCRGKFIRPVSDAPFDRTPARLARGAYLVKQVMLCPACHTSRATGNALLEPERADAFLGGGDIYADKTMGTAWVPNLTPDPETGLGAWSDDEILRALRDGVARDGHFLLPLMPFDAYRHASDEDARAVVVYLRTVPPYRQPKPRVANKLTFMQTIMFERVGVQMHKPVISVDAPAKTDTLAWGRYIAHLGACTECHSLTEKGPRPETDPLYLAGSYLAFEDPGLGQTYARNLTPDPETGLGNYDAAAIEQALRTGRRLDGRRMAPPMSVLIPHLSGLGQEDLGALVAYLKSVPAARHKVPDRNLVAALRGQLGD